MQGAKLIDMTKRISASRQQSRADIVAASVLATPTDRDVRESDGWAELSGRLSFLGANTRQLSAETDKLILQARHLIAEARKL